MEQLSQAQHVIAKLGGVSEAARILGHRNPTTVQGWITRGFIPGKRQREVLEGARRAGKSLTEDDFIVHLRGHDEDCEAGTSSVDQIDGTPGVECAAA